MQMYAPTRHTDHRTYRHRLTLTETLVLAALPAAALLAAAYPTAAFGALVGAVAAATLRR